MFKITEIEFTFKPNFVIGEGELKLPISHYNKWPNFYVLVSAVEGLVHVGRFNPINGKFTFATLGEREINMMLADCHKF